MERIYEFLPSVLVIASIAGITLWWVRRTIKGFGESFKSVEWHKNNQWKVFWKVSTPLAYVWFPMVEELIFRTPLVIVFDVISSFAWYGIFASSILFALTHWSGKKICMEEILLAQENDTHKVDDVIAEANRLHQENGKTIIVVRKALHVVLTLPLGILAGYYGIEYQSIWVSVGIHAAWNLIMPVVGPLLVLFGVVIFFCIASLWDTLKWRYRKLRGRQKKSKVRPKKLPEFVDLSDLGGPCDF